MSFSESYLGHMTSKKGGFVRAIRRVFPTLQVTKSVLRNFAITQVLPFLNNPKDLDPSYRMDLDFWDHLEGKKLCLITEEKQ